MVGHADDLVVAVVEDATLLATGGQHVVPVALLAAEAVVQLVAEAIRLEIVVAGQADAGMLLNPAPSGRLVT